jgi:hypothetical protein
MDAPKEVQMQEERFHACTCGHEFKLSACIRRELHRVLGATDTPRAATRGATKRFRLIHHGTAARDLLDQLLVGG